MENSSADSAHLPFYGRAALADLNDSGRAQDQLSSPVLAHTLGQGKP